MTNPRAELGSWEGARVPKELILQTKFLRKLSIFRFKPAPSSLWSYRIFKYLPQLEQSALWHRFMEPQFQHSLYRCEAWDVRLFLSECIFDFLAKFPPTLADDITPQWRLFSPSRPSYTVCNSRTYTSTFSSGEWREFSLSIMCILVAWPKQFRDKFESRRGWCGRWGCFEEYFPFWRARYTRWIRI